MENWALGAGGAGPAACMLASVVAAAGRRCCHWGPLCMGPAAVRTYHPYIDRDIPFFLLNMLRAPERFVEHYNRCGVPFR